jgi:hypothetical protein
MSNNLCDIGILLEETFVSVTIPTSESERLAIVPKNFLGELFHIIPTIRTINGEPFGIVITLRITNSNFILRDCGGFHSAYINIYLLNVNGFDGLQYPQILT